MLYYLFQQSGADWLHVNLFRYISFRGVLGAAIAFVTALLVGRPLMALLRRKMSTRSLHRKDHKELTDIHSVKQGTPNMGGLIMIAAALAGVLTVCDLTNIFVLGGLYVMLGFGFLGFIDDYFKLFSDRSKGLTKSQKIAWQFFMSALVAVLVIYFGTYHRLYPGAAAGTGAVDPTTLAFPGFKNLLFAVGPWGFLLWSFAVVGGSSNGVNLTDGLDGLATGCYIVAVGTFAVVTYVVTRADTSQYLNLLFVPNASELVVVCMTVAGACLGFLWFNAFPAEKIGRAHV
jgi:phospho-N-acetylmuramoyl-pentapeptide-transferase